MIEVTCHCGAVHLSVPAPPGEVTECNCSLCRRLGAQWAYYPHHEVRIAKPGSTRPYVWGDRMLAFHRCRQCGCTTHWQSLDGAQLRMAVNARMMDGLNMATVRVRQFDGADTWRNADAVPARDPIPA